MKHLKLWLSLMLICIMLVIPILTVNAATNTKLDAPKVSVTNVASTGKVKLTWRAVDDAEKYEVWRATSSTGTYTRISTTTNTYCTNTSGIAGKTYYYYVKAIAGKVSSKSNTVKRVCDLPRPTIKLTNVASSGKVKITWNAISGAKKYEVWRATASSGTYKRISTTTNTYCINTSGVAGTRYYYKVRAISSNSSANSAYSTVDYRICDLPRPVIKLTSVASSGKVKISWDAISGAKKYEVWRATSSSGTYKRISTTTNTYCINTSGVAGTRYYYKVRAISSNSSANSAYSTVDYRVCDLPRPTVSVTLNSNSKPVLKWNAVSGATKYQVWRATSSSGTYKRISTTTKTTCTNTSTVIGKKYYYKVIAVHPNSAANSAYSSVVSITTRDTSNLRYVAQPFTRFYTEPKASNVSGHYVDLPYMAEVEIVKNVTSGPSGTWTEVKYKNKTYYIWLTPDSDKLTKTMSTYEYKTDTKYQREVIDLALKIFNEWDTVYAHGQSQGIQNADGTYGFDCSGFVTYVHNTVMQKYYPSYRLSSSIGKLHDTTYISNGIVAVDVKLKDIQPGDVIFFNQDPSDGKPDDHCAIYLGNNEFIHASWSWDKSVCIQPLLGMYKDEFTCVRRYLP